MSTLRTFPQHRIRPFLSLNGAWDFLPECDRRPASGRLPRTYTRQAEIPQVWESFPDLRGYRGVGWYRRRFHLDSPASVRIAFGGVSHNAEVWVDGTSVATHEDAFTPWEAVVRSLPAGDHTVVVRVDNTFGDHSALHLPNDYYTYGGITRPVELQKVPEVFLEKIMAVPGRGRKDWGLDVRIRVRNLGGTHPGGKIRFRVAGAEKTLLVPELEPDGSREIAFSIKGLQVKTWSERSPELTGVEAVLVIGGTDVDDLLDRVGFREVKVKGSKLYLNGEELHLRGFNRHEDHPHFGCAIPLSMMAYDLDLFGDMNCNFLRTSHYPNDQRLLDLCDERGIYVWEESHARATPFDHPRFKDQIRSSTVEMVEHHMNHPCIITWGCLNECDSRSEEGAEVHKEVLGLLRELDSSRPITFASNKRTHDRCLGMVDIVSWNLYTGWYGRRPEDTGPVFEELLAWLDSDQSHGGKGKPVIMSEFGAGAIYGVRNPQHDFWSEEFQADLLDASLKAYLEHPRIVGAAVWQFCDVRTTREAKGGNEYTPMKRPRTMNNKGVVDEYRRPKLACDTVRKHMARAARLRGRV